MYTELPLLHRGLLLELGLTGDPPGCVFTRENLAPLARQGWTLDLLLDALGALTLKAPPPRVRKQLEDLFKECGSSP
jgi:hypothetical protein